MHKDGTTGAVDAPTDLVVCKFGGTSLATMGHVRDVARRLIRMQKDGRRVVAVLSAMGDSTDQLASLVHELSEGPPRRESDALLSLGESVSCALAALTVHGLGSQAVSLTASQAGVITDDAHGNARLFEIRPRRILEAVDDGKIVFVAGFQGVSSNGDVTTLGRGGSDASAVALAVALGVPRCEIFTDVPGVFSADPRVVAGARRLLELSHEEMLVFAAAGAAIVQPRAAELARTHEIEIHVRSTFTSGAGTWIRKEAGMLERSGITGVAHQRHKRVFTVREMTPPAVSSALARSGIGVSTLVRHGAEVRFIVPDADEDYVVAALQAAGPSLVSSETVGTVTVVGRGIGMQPEIAVRALSALERIGVDPELITSAPGQICFHVSSSSVHGAVRALHSEFRLEQTSGDEPRQAPTTSDGAASSALASPE